MKSLFRKIPDVNFNQGSLINLNAGLLVAGLGCVTAGWVQQNFPGKLMGVLITIMVILIGVLWHEMRWRLTAQKKNGSHFINIMFGKNEELPPFLYVLTVLVLIWAYISLKYMDDLFQSLLPLIGVVYFYIPWLLRLLKGKTRFWVTTAISLYLLGKLGLLLKWPFGANLFFSFANIAVVVIWGIQLPNLRLGIEQRWPGLAKKIYASAGSLYIVGFLLALMTTVFFLIVKQESLAEQFAMIGYFMLVVGIFLEAKDIFKNNHKQIEKKESIDSEAEENRA